PALATIAAVLLLVPVLALPNPQDAVIAQQRVVREAADRQAERLEEVARDLETKGEDANDPRRQLAPVENDVRARIDPATEQRASAMTSLARSLSRAATGDQDANRDGDPDET